MRNILMAISVIIFSVSCHRNSSTKKAENISPQEMDIHISKGIANLLGDADKKTNKADDSTLLYAMPVLDFYYPANAYKPLWSGKEKWKPAADSLINYLQHCEWDGLFKEDYQFKLLQALKITLASDSLKRMTSYEWARADLLMTDAYVHLLQDLKQGRLQPDSLGWKNSKLKHTAFFKRYLDTLSGTVSIHGIAQSLQPHTREYLALKEGIPAFLDSMDAKKYTYLYYPNKDSAGFLKRLITRLNEAGVAGATMAKLDSAKLSSVISSYQKAKGIKPTGKLSVALVSSLNNTGQEKFKRIAITLDRYKQLPEQMPEKYIWVNLPSFYLQVWDKDSLVMESKVVVGKPETQTPDITSEISDLVIYPTWTVPNSIIVKDILPGLKRNAGYLTRKGLGLYDNSGDPVDPHSINWAKYSKGMPYYVRQNSGDNNALGVIKFNFNNPYSVYLHDTNQRYLFKNGSRSLSHGCVRVQDWQKLAFYIVRNDSIHSSMPDTLKLSTDSITSWIKQKQKHVVGIRERMPVFIRYFSCEGKNNRVRFYDDIYNKDKAMREKYFALK
jgi:L,D-transpeptidase YcbB